MKMEKLKIKDLWVLNCLKEMSGAILNHKINDNFYDYYMHKDLSWLVENGEKIINDFYDNFDEFMFEFTNGVFNYAGRWNEEILLEALKDIKS